MNGGSGFTPGDALYLLECLASSTSQADCDVKTAPPVTVSTQGTLSGAGFTDIARGAGRSLVLR